MDYEGNVSKTYSWGSSFGLLLLRLIPFAMLIAFHGWGKLTGAYAYLVQGEEWKFIEGVQKLGFPYPEYFALAAVSAETLFCLLVIVGLLTRFSAAVIAFNMIVAVYRHMTTDFQIESAALYLAPALALLFLGAGRFSLDGLIRRARTATAYERETIETDYDPVTGKTRRIVREFPEETTEKLDSTLERRL